MALKHLDTAGGPLARPVTPPLFKTSREVHGVGWDPVLCRERSLPARRLCQTSKLIFEVARFHPGLRTIAANSSCFLQSGLVRPPPALSMSKGQAGTLAFCRRRLASRLALPRHFPFKLPASSTQPPECLHTPQSDNPLALC